MNEKELLERLKKRDSTAQKYLFDKYSALFYGICLRYAYTNDEAEDILQEGFLKIYMNIKKYSGSGSFEGWMKKIIINNAINYYHKDYKYRHYSDIKDIGDVADDIEVDEYDLSHEDLLKVIQELPPGYKQVFNLYAIEGYKHKDIADIMEISENTSKSQYHRAKKILVDKIHNLIAARENNIKNRLANN